MSVRDLRLTGLGGRASTIHNRSRSDSRVSKLSRTSSRYSMSGTRGRQSSFQLRSYKGQEAQRQQRAVDYYGELELG
eukprot:jgi/Phyca11/506479/fgenesh2_kg.PHYCAscaffold_20_\